jgi:hypothetical protein
MILDGHWKLELKKSINALRFWRKVAGGLHTDFADHQVNRQILYSTVIVRKIIEDEKWAKNDLKDSPLPMPPFAILHSEIKVIEYPYVGDKDFVGFRPWTDDYDVDGRTAGALPLEHACNSIIHSYVWSLVRYEKKKDIAAFVMASDKFKSRCMYLIMLDDWLDKLQFCLNHCHV